ncbi:MAG TPA: C40 family peptidase [Streptosporangiaceae bacterium]|nr:C40 family peptidase [Streptosporangiaceae bacterium]
MRDGTRRLRAALWVAVVLGVVAAFSPRVVVPLLPRTATAAHSASGESAAGGRLASRGTSGSAGATQAPAAGSAEALRRYAAVLSDIGKTPSSASHNAVAQAAAARKQAGQTEVTAAQKAGVFLPGQTGAATSAVRAGRLSDNSAGPRVRPLGTLRQADLLVVAPSSLPAASVSAIRKLPGVTAANQLDAARIKVNGGFVAMLGVDPSTFRDFAAKPTAKSTVLWQNVADGGIAVSYLMGEQEKLPIGGTVEVAGARTEELPVAGFGTVGISGVDAVVSDAVATSLGMPAGNAIVISAPHARLSTLIRQIRHGLPKGASVAPLVGQAPARGLPVTQGSAGALGLGASSGPGLTVAQTRAFLTAALSRVGMRYVWGGAGPYVFDCSGLVQWSMRQAGIIMPRVAVNQAQTGPRIPLSELEPGDLLFYHTDPTAPTYISHVAIYLGSGLMLQAPEPGEDVEVVPAIFGGGFAGAVEVFPRIAAVVAANSPE